MYAKKVPTFISKQIMDIQDDGQDIQHFITDSPWSAKSVFYTIQEEPLCFFGKSDIF